MTSETLKMTLAWLAGAALGVMFFGGLWWTVRRGLSSQKPALWFLGSLLARMAVALTGFYFVSGGDWRRLVLCLLGFVMARTAITRLAKSPAGIGGRPPEEVNRAT
jgi:F1F0 ATPase subunit 2